MAETDVTAAQRVTLLARSRYIGCDTCTTAAKSAALVPTRISRSRPPAADSVADYQAAAELPV
jgi:hypothetical protein